MNRRAGCPALRPAAFAAFAVFARHHRGGAEARRRIGQARAPEDGTPGRPFRFSFPGPEPLEFEPEPWTQDWGLRTPRKASGLEGISPHHKAAATQRGPTSAPPQSGRATSAARSARKPKLGRRNGKGSVLEFVISRSHSLGAGGRTTGTGSPRSPQPVTLARGGPLGPVPRPGSWRRGPLGFGCAAPGRIRSGDTAQVTGVLWLNPPAWERRAARPVGFNEQLCRNCHCKAATGAAPWFACSNPRLN